MRPRTFEPQQFTAESPHHEPIHPDALVDLTTSLQYPTLQDDTNETVRTLVISEKQILTSDARWFSVRIMPYRRIDNVIDGAVITFVDITETKALESRLRKDSSS